MHSAISRMHAALLATLISQADALRVMAVFSTNTGPATRMTLTEARDEWPNRSNASLASSTLSRCELHSLCIVLRNLKLI